MTNYKNAIWLGTLLLIFAGCAGEDHQSHGVAPPDPIQDPNPEPRPEYDDQFIFHSKAPHANPLPYDAQDVARPAVSAQGHQDSAAVLVYADHGGKRLVLLARRAPWLSSPGTWGVFMGSVETTDLDSSGHMSFARAAEHELYEESVTIYHETDANALRACPAHVKHYGSGLQSRTFFARQPYVPEERFKKGYSFAVQAGKPAKFRENDQYRWVLLKDLSACADETWEFTDAAGAQHTMRLFKPFFKALSESHYKGHLRALP